MRTVALVVTIAFSAGAPLPGQETLLARHAGKMLPVVQAKDKKALVVVDGKLTAADGNSFTFHKADEFLPLFVSVGELWVGNEGEIIPQLDTPINNDFVLRATFESVYEIPEAYVVIQLLFTDGTKKIFVHEVGSLQPGRPRQQKFVVSLHRPLGAGRYVLHIFSRGQELLHSAQPPDFRQQALDRIVAKRIARLPDGPPSLLVGPAPQYPAALKKSRLRGTALLHCTVRPNGAVADITVKSASDAAMGEAAVVAVREWRFLPQIKDGIPAVAEVNLPFNFAPPDKN